MLNLNKHYILYTEMMKPQSLLCMCHEPRPTVKGKSIFSSSVMEKRTEATGNCLDMVLLFMCTFYNMAVLQVCNIVRTLNGSYENGTRIKPSIFSLSYSGDRIAEFIDQICQLQAS
jgi:hypothetical protein